MADPEVLRLTASEREAEQAERRLHNEALGERPVRAAQTSHGGGPSRNKSTASRLAEAVNSSVPRGGNADWHRHVSNAKYPVETARQMYLSGASVGSIAAQFGVSKHTIKGTASRFGWAEMRRAALGQGAIFNTEISRQRREALGMALKVGRQEGIDIQTEMIHRRMNATNLVRMQRIMDTMLSGIEREKDPDPGKAIKVVDFGLKLSRLQKETFDDKGPMASAEEAGVPNEMIDEEEIKALEKAALEAEELRTSIENSNL